MKILKSMIMAFSLYSKIPTPQISWDEDSTEHAISFLPFIGSVIGAASYLVLRIAQICDLPVFFVTLMLILIPVLITGGFHLDGFMDVQDALCSYQPRDKKLEIMKDPHIGAFAVISVGALLLIWTGFLYLLITESMNRGNRTLIFLYCISFAFSRALCAFTSIVLPKAKRDGLLNMETQKSKRGDLIFLGVQAVAALVAMLLINMPAAGLCAAVIVLHVIWYTAVCKRNFGGVTGDTAGFFVVTAETVLVVLLGMCSLIIRLL